MKTQSKYIGRTVEMFENNWTAKIINVDKYGWTVQVVKPYYNGKNSIGDILFYSHSKELYFRFLD